jgi:glyoxylase-like metal-dependent hydrolase (beta-lactamase superfamily II)
VHCYAIDDPEGWTIVDAGLGDAATMAGWRAALDELGDPHVRRVVITHFHADHVGASAGLVALTGASEVVEGRDDLQSAVRSFGPKRDDFESGAYLASLGMPQALVDAWLASSFANDIELATPSRLVDEGDELEIAGTPYRVLVLRGHADGHIVLHDERDGRMFGGDVLLQRITPNVGKWEDSRPNPLGDYLETLGRLEQLAPRLIYPGHRALIEDAPARAAETRAHHDARLDATAVALRSGAETPYDVSMQLWGDHLGLHERRFALAEALAHLVHLGALGLAVEHEPGRWRLS